GINHGAKNGEGKEFPLAADLATSIAQEILTLQKSEMSLEEAAEIARYRYGEKHLNDYLHRYFKGFRPSTQHLELVQLPWDAIYTTNYDTLIEQAASTGTIKPAGRIKPVFSTSTDLTEFVEDDIIYYKLHGSVDSANSPDGRLILTKEDYRHYE